MAFYFLKNPSILEMAASITHTSQAVPEWTDSKCLSNFSLDSKTESQRSQYTFAAMPW